MPAACLQKHWRNWAAPPRCEFRVSRSTNYTASSTTKGGRKPLDSYRLANRGGNSLKQPPRSIFRRVSRSITCNCHSCYEEASHLSPLDALYYCATESSITKHRALVSLYLEEGGGARTPAQTDCFCALAQRLVGSGLFRFRPCTCSASPTLCRRSISYK
jgi:hypothetical protein